MTTGTVGSAFQALLRRHGLPVLFLVLLCFAVGLPKLQVGILPQDEGILLAYPSLILRGFLPYQDFAALYPPTNFYVIAATFQVFGEHIAVQRLLGIGYWLAMALSLYALGCQVSRTVGVLAALSMPLAVIFYVIGAYSMVGALALVVAALACGVRSLIDGLADSPSGRQRWALASGLAAGAVLGFRQDVGAVALCALGLAYLGSPMRLWRWFALGAVAALVPLLLFLTHLGWGLVYESTVLDVLRNAPGRRLPVTFTLPLIGLFAVVAFLVVNGLWASRWMRGPSAAAAVFFARTSAWLAVGLMPSVLQRADNGHIAYVGAPLLGLAVVAAGQLAQRRLALPIQPRSARPLVVGLLLVSVLLVSISLFKNRKPTARIVVGDRWVHHSDASSAAQAQAAIDGLLARAQPGDRVFIGPADLRFANHNDSYLWHLLPGLVPASRYIEMNPGVGNRSGSGLPQQIATARFLLLSSRYADWDEPNASMLPGSDEANVMVATRFCLQQRFGHWQLLARCEAGSR